MAYDTKEAARLISWSNKQAGIGPLTEAELIEWIDDGVGLLEWEDVWDEEENKYIDFSTLISLRMICLLRASEISLESIKEVALLMRQKLGLDWPYASRSFWDPASVDSKNAILLDSDVMDQIVGTLVTHVAMNSAADALEFGKDGVAYAWRPVEGVVIDSRVVSGSPCVTGTRTPTWSLTVTSKDENIVKELSEAYRLTEKQVRNALDWEAQLDAAAV